MHIFRTDPSRKLLREAVNRKIATGNKSHFHFIHYSITKFPICGDIFGQSNVLKTSIVPNTLRKGFEFMFFKINSFFF